MADTENQISQTSPETQTFAFVDDSQVVDSSSQQIVQDSVDWVASEFIFHEKKSSWYGGLAAVSFVVVAILYLITRDLISVGVVLFGSLMFGVYAGRKPRQLEYKVSDSGLFIGQKAFRYSEFKAFSVVQEDAFSSMVFLPLKRFSPLTTIYYPPDQEDKIVSIVSNHLPLEERTQDPIDRLMHKIGF